jgi:hypothetical protein
MAPAGAATASASPGLKNFSGPASKRSRQRAEQNK